MPQLSQAMEAYLAQVDDHLPAPSLAVRAGMMAALRDKLSTALASGMPEAELLAQMGDAPGLAITWSENHAPSPQRPGSIHLRTQSSPPALAQAWPTIQAPAQPTSWGVMLRAIWLPAGLALLACAAWTLLTLFLRHHQLAPQEAFPALKLLWATWPHLLAWWLPFIPLCLGALALPAWAAHLGHEGFSRFKLFLSWGTVGLSLGLSLMAMLLLEGPGVRSSLRVEQVLLAQSSNTRPFSLPPAGMKASALAAGMATLQAKLHGPNALPAEAWEARDVLQRRHTKLQVGATMRLALPALNLGAALLGLSVGLLLIQRPWAAAEAKAWVRWGAWAAVGGALGSLAWLGWLLPQALWPMSWLPMASLWLPFWALLGLTALLEASRRLGRA